MLLPRWPGPLGQRHSHGTPAKLLRSAFVSTLAVVLVSVSAGALSAQAAEWEWNRDCGDNPLSQPFEVRDLDNNPGLWTFITGNPFQLQPSDSTGSAQICGSWARRTPVGQNVLTYGGANSHIIGATVFAPYGVQIDPMVDNPEVSDGDYVGNAQVQAIVWPFSYRFDPQRLNLQIHLRADSRRQEPLTKQLPGDGPDMETRKGCPLDQDLPNPDTQKVIICSKVDVPGALGSNWNWTVRDDAYTQDDRSDDTFFVTVGELFGPANTYGTVVKIQEFYQCERPGGPEPQCGDESRPNINFNGFADDKLCSQGLGVYLAVATRRTGKPLQTDPAYACMPWLKR